MPEIQPYDRPFREISYNERIILDAVQAHLDNCTHPETSDRYLRVSQAARVFFGLGPIQLMTTGWRSWPENYNPLQDNVSAPFLE